MQKFKYYYAIPKSNFSLIKCGSTAGQIIRHLIRARPPPAIADDGEFYSAQNEWGKKSKLETNHNLLLGFTDVEY